MGWGDDEKESSSSSWAFSTEPSSSTVDEPNGSGVSAFSTEPTQNTGERQLSNWGEAPRTDDPPTGRSSVFRSLFSRFFSKS